MNNDELKKIIGQYLADGFELPEIQDKLLDEHGENMTFLELRLLAAELDDIDWTKREEPEEVEEQKDDEDDVQAPQATDKTVVEVSKIARPDAVLSGTVTFASGASADWKIDQFGRCAFENRDGEPTQQEIMEFQQELQRKLSGGAM